MPHPVIKIDEGLKTWATETQSQYIDLVNSMGSMSKAAKHLGIRRENITRGIQSLKLLAARRGYSPDHDMTRPVPETHVAQGISTYYDADGKVRAQWVKSTLDNEAAEAAKRAALAAMAEELPRVSAVKFKGSSISHLATLYTLTDCHVGMLAWGRETNSGDWDLKIAERVLTECFDQMIQSAPRSRVGIVNQLGDFLHQDGLAALTPTSGHQLDSDGRMGKIIEVAIRILRRVIDMALEKHEVVIAMMQEGNHDPVSSIWLRALFRALYENEPRITVIDSPLPYCVYRHGSVLLAFHHGHLKKNDQLPMLIAAQFPREWGDTTKRYCHTGHRHHVEEKEHSGITVIQHPTLAARDAYAARGGWVAERQVSAITYHERFGRVRVDSVVPEMLEEA